MISIKTNSNARNLRRLAGGQSGIVDRVRGTTSTAKRLADMGFVQGARVEMLRPGKPCLVRIGTACVGLGTSLQECIEIV